MSENSRDLSAVHQRAMTFMDEAASVLWDERQQCLEDRRFANVPGAQWEDDFGSDLEGLPKMEINKVRRGVRRLLSRYRKNRITVDFRPDGGQADAEVADKLDGLYRADEQASGAQEAYDNAADEGFTGGIGAWRLRNVYADELDEEDERQRVAIEPIFDADVSVFFDLNAKRRDKADAKHCMVLVSMTRGAFDQAYPGKSPSSVDGIIPRVFDWFTPDVVYIGEWYEVEEQSDRLLTFRHPLLAEGIERRRESDLSAEERADLEAKGWRLDTTRKIKRRRVRKYIVSGAAVLEDCGFIAGPNIPIVPVYGERVYIQNVERASGYVRFAKDPQRVYNLQISKLSEIGALAQHERPVLTPEQVRGHEQSWAEGHVKRLPYQLVNPITNADGSQTITGPVATLKAPDVPTPLAALIQITGADIREMTGANSGTESLVSNVSADAIEQVNTRVDDEADIYMDGFAEAMRRSGEIWLGMMREIADEDEERELLTAEGETSSVKLGEVDIWSGKYKVVPYTGPSSATRRDATAKNLVKMAAAAGADPELQGVLLSTAMLNMDGEGLGDVQRWIRGRLVRAGVVQPTDEERAQMMADAENAPPDPQAQLAAAASEQALAEAEKAKAGTIKTLADVERTRAETVKTLAEVDRGELDQALRVVLEATDRLGGIPRAEPPAPREMEGELPPAMAGIAGGIPLGEDD